LHQQQDIADFVRWREAETALNQATAAQRSLQTQLEQAETEAHVLGDAHYQIQVDEQVAQQGLSALTEQRAALREQAARLEEQIQHAKQSRERNERDKQQTSQQLQNIGSERTQLQEGIASLQIQLEEQQLAHEEWQLQLESLHEAQPEHELAIDASNQAWQNQQDTQHRMERELALLTQQLQQSQARIMEWQTRQNQLRDELAALALPEAAVLAAAQERVDVLQVQTAELETVLESQEEQAQDLQAALTTAQQQAQQCQQQVMQLEAKHKALSALLPQNSADDVWADSDAAVLWQHITVAPAWRDAVQTLLRERQHARTAAPNKRPVNQAATWLTGNQIPQHVLPDSLAQHIQADAGFQDAINLWLGHIRCADNLEAALAEQGELSQYQCLMTPQAELVDAVSVQCLAASGDQALQHQAEINDLNLTLETALPALTQAQQQVSSLQEQLQHSQQQHKQTQAQHKLAHEQLRIANTEATKLLERTQQGQLRHEHIAQELHTLAESLEHTHMQQGQWQQEQQQLTLSQQQLQQDFAGLSAQREALQQQVKHSQLQILEVQRQQGLVSLALQKNQQAIAHQQQRLQQLHEQETQWFERQQSLALFSAEDEAQQSLQAAFEALTLQIKTLDEHIGIGQEQLKQLQQQRQHLQQQQQQLEQQLPQWRAQLQQQLLNAQQAQMNKQRYGEQLQERGANWTALQEIADVDAGKLQQQISSIAKQLQAMGAVNLAALQELSEARERFDYYQNQRNDVQQAMDALHEAIAQIDNETKTLFQQTFDAVNTHMQEFFPTLFGGGEAHLQLIGDDMLNAGVAIMARPPGKKNSTIHLLSGGEKALTAMSLVFALFSLNPAPFCLLDEVDAPLDDANTSRFCRLVEQMSQHTQFLYISHNRLTMEMAEQLIGVTMQEKGVSRIVEVDIKQALELAAQ
jgi:chromosome segregation protein